MTVRRFEQHQPDIHGTAWVHPSAEVIGDVSLGSDSSVWPLCVLRGDIHFIRIGARTNVQDGTIVHVTHASRFTASGHGVVIGDGVTIGHKVVLHGCTIEDRCLIGMGATVMDGARIRSGAMVGAGSLVTPGKELEGGHLWLGAPVRKVRPLTAEERDYLDYSAEHYVRLMRRHRASEDGA